MKITGFHSHCLQSQCFANYFSRVACCTKVKEIIPLAYMQRGRSPWLSLFQAVCLHILCPVVVRNWVALYQFSWVVDISCWVIMCTTLSRKISNILYMIWVYNLEMVLLPFASNSLTLLFVWPDLNLLMIHQHYFVILWWINFSQKTLDSCILQWDFEFKKLLRSCEFSIYIILFSWCLTSLIWIGYFLPISAVSSYVS